MRYLVVVFLAIDFVMIAAGKLYAAQPSAQPFWVDDKCPEHEIGEWCRSRLRSDGWVLKYNSFSPKGMLDTSWSTEVWIKEGNALLCQARFIQGAALANRCELLTTIDP